MSNSDKEARNPCEDASTMQFPVDKQITKLKGICAGKKGSITKRINQLTRLVSEGGSRTKINFLCTALEDVRVATKEAFQEMASLMEEPDTEWMEEVDLRVDICVAEVQEYIDARKDDPPSTTSMTASWVRDHTPYRSTVQFEERRGAGITGDMPEQSPSQHAMFGSSLHQNIIGADINQFTSERRLSEDTHFVPRGNSMWPSGYENADQVQLLSSSSSQMRDQLINTIASGDNYENIMQNHLHSNAGIGKVTATIGINDQPINSPPNMLQRKDQQFHRGSNPCVSVPPGFGNTNSMQTTAMLNQVIPSATTNSTIGVQNPASTPVQLHEQVSRNHVDSWIDDLDVTRTTPAPQDISSNVTMAWLIQQSLPRVKIPIFDGNPLSWVEFITKFRDLVHNQAYLQDSQRRVYLLQHLTGEAKRSVQGFADDQLGYIKSLKRLKYMFGQRQRIAQATLAKVTRGKPILNDDHNGLVEYFYTISDCLVTLKMLNYSSDLYSCDILRQTLRRLPSKLHNRWAEYCLNIRGRNEEPNLIHLESWLQARVLAQKDSYLPQNEYRSKQRNLKDDSRGEGELKGGSRLVGATLTDAVKCILCKGQHRLWKCEKFKTFTPSQKYEQVKKLKLCYNCLTDNHVVTNCSSRHRCFTKGCSAKHHTSLHDYFGSKKVLYDTKKEDKKTDQIEKADVGKFNGMVTSSNEIYLQIVPVQLLAPHGKSTSTYALLDSGSQSTLIRADVAKRLKLKGTRKNIKITTIKDKEEKLQVEEVSFDITSKDGNERFKVESAYIVPSEKFNMPSQPLPSDYHDTDVYTHLDGINLDAVKAEDISILIGANVPDAILPLEVRRGTSQQPLAIRTKLGWTLFGASSTADGVHNYMCNMIHTSEDDEMMNTILETFWTQEHYATTSERDVGMSIEDKSAERILEIHTKKVDGKYQVPMLWKEADATLPNNLPQARRRFEFLQKRLRADTDLFEKYKANISKYLEMGYAKVMTTEEEQRTSTRTWYLPHHPVFNPNKPGKLRVVFDAAATYKGRSLNEALITGPDLLNNLVGVLLRFRRDAVAIAADVEAMFHQVKVDEHDAESLRFLWKDDMHSESPPNTLQMLVHIFGAKDSPSCANYAIKCAARDNYQDFDAATYECALKSFYADDLLKSVESEEAAIRLSKQMIDMMNRGGFRLTKFFSNRKAVLEALPTPEVAQNIVFGLDRESIERTLGINWEINQDIFTFQAHIKEAPFTKRGILRTVSSIFDPLGFLGPYIVKAKIFIQELWRQGCGWDEEINPEFTQYWRSWLEGAKNIKRFELSRCYTINIRTSNIELHIFGDASEQAYGAVAYLKFTSKEDRYESILVISKSKLAPIKSVTLPRLELSAAVLAARIYRNIIKELDLPIERTYFWTDSTLILQYIRNKSKRFKTYVANRVAEILEVSHSDQWKYVPGEQNPADMVTRGVSDPAILMEQDKYGKRWTTGPAFLCADETSMPEEPLLEPLESTDPEVKSKKILMTSFGDQNKVIEVERFSKWSRLKRAIAWMLRFLHNCLRGNQNAKLVNHLSYEEICSAEFLLIREVQHEVFALEISILEQKKSLPIKNKLSPLCPFLDEKGIMRVGGRLKHARIPVEAKHQIILPKRHHVTMLIVRQEHEKNGHIGREHVLCNLRQFFWILNARAAIKGVIYKCFHCKIKRAKQIQPFMSDLPKGRLAYGEAPFTHCGVDLFGPVYIKQGRKRLKRWGVIFTCLTIRCVHLEVVENADTDSFISSLRRFVNRRGKPHTMYSDCGTNFKGATKELKDLIADLDKAQIANFATEKGIEWKFNPPAAPHMGGIWERLVRSVKEVMIGIMQDKILTDWQLVTLLTEVESILNSRPLTHSSEDPDDLEALTPNHALVGHTNNWHQMGKVPERLTCRKRWKQVQFISNCFWKRWIREYLPQLTTRSFGREMIPNHNVGDLVLLTETDVSRSKWPLARITKVMPGPDGVVRVAEVKTKNGVYVRPVTKLYKLEETEIPHGEGNVDDTTATVLGTR